MGVQTIWSSAMGVSVQGMCARDMCMWCKRCVQGGTRVRRAMGVCKGCECVNGVCAGDLSVSMGMRAQWVCVQGMSV